MRCSKMWLIYIFGAPLLTNQQTISFELLPHQSSFTCTQLTFLPKCPREIHKQRISEYKTFHIIFILVASNILGK